MENIISYALAREVAEKVYGSGSGAQHGILPSDPDPKVRWTLDTSFNRTGELSTPEGFFAYALKPVDSTDKRRILAFRGTEKLKDYLSDASSIGQNQFNDRRVTDRVNTYLADNYKAGLSTELVGHSLGGALVQWATNNSNLQKVVEEQIKPSPGFASTTKEAVADKLHFSTFNAPGISLAPGAIGDANIKTSAVSGEHHVIALTVAGKAPFLVGDPVHILGGSPVGGKLVAHQVDFAALGSSGAFAHSITPLAWWNSPTVLGYKPPFPVDLQHAQVVGRWLSDTLLGSKTESEAVAGAKLAIILTLGLGAGSSIQLGGQLKQLAKEASVDPKIFATALGMAGEDGLKAAIRLLVENKKGTAEDAARLVIRVLNAVYEAQRTLYRGASEALSYVSSFLKNVATSFAKSLADVSIDLTKKFGEKSIGVDPLGNLIAYKPLENIFSSAAKDPNTPSGLRPALEAARVVIDGAGERPIVAAVYGKNPFNNVSFDPDKAPAPTTTINHAGQATYAVYLPYEAGEGGQRIQFKLTGDTANSLRVQVGNRIITPTGGLFELTVHKGSKEATFTPLAEGDVPAKEQVRIDATLLDASGKATHKEHLQGTLTVNAKSAQPSLTRDVLGGGEPVNFGTPANPVYRTDDLGNLITRNPGGTRDDTLRGGNQNVHIVGGKGRDSILAGSGNDLIEGNGGGAKIIHGGSGKSLIFADRKVNLLDAINNPAPRTNLKGAWIDAGTGDSTVVGSANNDVLTGNGNNLFIAGNGDNYILGHRDWLAQSYDWSVTRKPSGDYLFSPVGVLSAPNDAKSDTIYAGNGNNHLELGNGNNFAAVGKGNNTIIGGSGDNNILAGDGNNEIFADLRTKLATNASQDYIEVGDGNNYIEVGKGASTIIVGAGHDTIVGHGGDNYIEVRGGRGASFVDAGSGNNTVIGGDGADTIKAGDGNNSVVGGAGASRIVLGKGNNTVRAGDGANAIQVGDGANTIEVGNGNDSIIAGSGANTIFIGDGNDTVFVGDGANTIVAGNGNDFIKLGKGNNPIWLGDGTDAVRAGDGNNVIHAGNGRDVIVAGNGRNTLYAGAGEALLVAGSGENTIVGGSGRAQLIGGGNTTYRFEAGNGASEVLLGATVLSQDGGENLTVRSTGTDTLEFGSGLSASDLTLSAALGQGEAPALVLKYAGGGTAIVDGGASVTPLQLAERANTVSTTVAGAQGNFVFGAKRGELLIGGRGNDEDWRIAA